MKNRILILLLLIFGCSYKPLIKFDSDNLSSLKSKSIIDLTIAVDFAKDDSLKIVDSLYLDKISSLIRSNSKDSKVIYLAKHGDRQYLNAFQYRAESVLRYFVNLGCAKEKIEAEIGLDFQSKYSELENSWIVLLVH